MNVMLTSAGRRAYMVKYFKEALEGTGSVHAGNSDNVSVAFKYADRTVITPLIFDSGYIPFLLEYCRKNEIGVLLSLFDMDSLVLARHKSEFEEAGTKVIVSDPEIIEICNDKWKTYEFLMRNGFHAPKSFLRMEEVLRAVREGDMHYPIVVKPRFGCGSLSVELACDEEDLRFFQKRVNNEIRDTYLKYESAVTEDKVIFQEWLKGDEYGADIINDLQGNLRNVIVRRKIAMRSGETDVAELVDEPVIREELIRLGRVTKHIANMDCDVFLDDGVPYILEMNARFGGGYPFSHMGGCDLPKAILSWVQGKVVPAEMLMARTGVTGFKEICITEM